MKKPTSLAGGAGFSKSKEQNGNPVLFDDEAFPQAHRQRSRVDLREPITVAKFWKNRTGDAIVTQLREWKERPFVDVRVHTVGKDGIMRPTTRGVAVKMSLLPTLKDAVDKAHAQALALGLLGQPIDDGEG
jgi:hypothetical protein